MSTAETTNRATKEMKELALEFHEENKLANMHAGAAKKARGYLMRLMEEKSIKLFSFNDQNWGAVDVEIASGRSTSVVDMKKLRAIVADDEKLLSVCSMSKTDVAKFFGTAIAESVSKSVPSAENVQVKAAR